MSGRIRFFLCIFLGAKNKERSTRGGVVYKEPTRRLIESAELFPYLTSVIRPFRRIPSHHALHCLTQPPYSPSTIPEPPFPTTSLTPSPPQPAAGSASYSGATSPNSWMNLCASYPSARTWISMLSHTRRFVSGPSMSLPTNAPCVARKSCGASAFHIDARVGGGRGMLCGVGVSVFRSQRETG